MKQEFCFVEDQNILHSETLIRKNMQWIDFHVTKLPSPKQI